MNPGALMNQSLTHSFCYLDCGMSTDSLSFVSKNLTEFNKNLPELKNATDSTVFAKPWIDLQSPIAARRTISCHLRNDSGTS